MNLFYTPINIKKLRCVGIGASNVCFTDGTYAIKVGNTTAYEVERLRRVYEDGFGANVYEYINAATIEQIAVFKKVVARGYYDGGEFSKHVPYQVRKNSPTILIVQYIKPFLSHKKAYTETYKRYAYKVASTIAEQYEEKTGRCWNDNHPWNLGKMNGKYYILDV